MYYADEPQIVNPTGSYKFDGLFFCTMRCVHAYQATKPGTS